MQACQFRPPNAAFCGFWVWAAFEGRMRVIDADTADNYNLDRAQIKYIYHRCV